MSKEYDLYLEQHKGNVAKGFYWIRDNLPGLMNLFERLSDCSYLEYQICHLHDASKTDAEEYAAYDRYFYGDSNSKSYETNRNFKYAWLSHIHKNPHHWQHFVLNNDEPKEGEVILDMPLNYILEMVCDWWAFSWNTGNLFEIFDWYDKHKDYMKLSSYTRDKVELILSTIRAKLEES